MEPNTSWGLVINFWTPTSLGKAPNKSKEGQVSTINKVWQGKK
jgi:hypothetical protein